MEWLLVVVGGALLLPALAVAVSVRHDQPLAPALGAGAAFVGVEFLSLVLLFIAGFACDESCEDPPEVWRDDPDAWQWDVIGIGAWVSLAAGAVALFALAYRRRRLALAALVPLLAAQLVAWSFAL